MNVVSFTVVLYRDFAHCVTPYKTSAIQTMKTVYCSSFYFNMCGGRIFQVWLVDVSSETVVFIRAKKTLSVTDEHVCTELNWQVGYNFPLESEVFKYRTFCNRLL